MIKYLLKAGCSSAAFGFVIANYYPFMTPGLARIQERANR